MLILILLLMQAPQMPTASKPGAELVDFSKLPETDVGTPEGPILGKIADLRKAGYEINEPGIIAALRDSGTSSVPAALANDPVRVEWQASQIRSAAASLISESILGRLKVNLRTPATTAALQDAFHDAILSENHPGRSNRSRDIGLFAGTLAAVGDTTSWVNEVAAELSKMESGDGSRYSIALLLNSVGRYEGWPYVLAEVMSNDASRIFSGLQGIELFDGKPNPDGGRPIDVAKELHQIAANTSDDLLWPSFASDNKQRVKDLIEVKAMQVEKVRAQK